MMIILDFLLTTMAAAASPTASPYIGSDRVVERNDAVANSTGNSLTVDLGYEVYQGWTNASAHLNIWQGHVFCAVRVYSS